MSLSKIDRNTMPNHIAIIMDGNGRWAKKRGLRREKGHQAGKKSVKKIIESCIELGIKYLTLYAFSTENWNRPKIEIDFLMQLLFLSLNDEFENLNKNNIKFDTIGNLERLPKKISNYLEKVKLETNGNSTLTLTLALSYGSRYELIDAMKEISLKVKNNIISSKNIDETVINNHLYTRNLPDVDLLIRTSGEKRISNFLLWQIAYSELYFTEKLWPDFEKKDLYKALICYQNRERRFGKTSDQIK